MRRLMNLQDTLYHKKFRKIYKVVFTADLDEVKDFSNWYKESLYVVNRKVPLWIICESTILNKRIWIIKEYGIYRVTTSNLNNNINNNEAERHRFKTQKETVIFLNQLLRPCLETNDYFDNEQLEKVS